MLLSIIMPVYNERKTIADILYKVKDTPFKKEIIVVDDGSDDGTTEFLKNLTLPEIKVFFHAKNIGKGQAVRTGILNATGDIILIQDADLEYDPDDYPMLIEPILKGRAEVVYGSRWLNKGLKNVHFSMFKLGRWFLTLLTNLLYKANITDESCGYKVFKSDIIKNIPLGCKRFEFCPEITAKLLRRAHKIYEVPVKYSPRNISEGKKITYKDGFDAILTLLKYRFWR